MVLPNALEIITKDSKFVFSTFMKRDDAYHELTKIHSAFQAHSFPVPLASSPSTPAIIPSPSSVAANPFPDSSEGKQILDFEVTIY